MVRIVVRPGSSIKSTSGTVIKTTGGGTSLGASGPSAGTTSTANNVSIRPGASINQISPSVTPIIGTSGVSYVSAGTRTSSSSESASSESNYKLSVASMLLAMKNQTLGSLSLGGSKSGGSITENISGVNLG